jgi:tRNA(His) 5'-end guanylyltransferase
MQFEQLDVQMRVYETAYDRLIPDESYIVVRIDGRGFTRLTKETHDFEIPFDSVFRDYMIQTTKHLMQCGFRILYGYTQSDEISLLFDPGERQFGRKERKINSVLAGEASACFSLLMGSIASFDCRVSQLPDAKTVVDYFRWRHEDAFRNMLNAWCYWTLRKNGMSPESAAEQISGQEKQYKIELLAGFGIVYDELPAWQKRGVGMCYQRVQKTGFNPLSQMHTVTERKELVTELNLPEGREYDRFLSQFLTLSQ